MGPSPGQPSSPASSRALDGIKAELTSAPALRVWDPARPTGLIVDASELAVPAILEPPDGAGAFHPVAFESSNLKPAGVLAPAPPVHALKALLPYLSDKPIELHTDNATRKRFPDGPDRRSTRATTSRTRRLVTAPGAVPASALAAAGPATESPRSLHADLAAAVRAALRVLGSLAVVAQAQDPSTAGPSRCSFVTASSAAMGCSTAAASSAI